MGATLAKSFADYTDLVDEEEKAKAQMREALRAKKKKLKVKDITKAIVKNEKSNFNKNATKEDLAAYSDHGNQVSNSDATTDHINNDGGIAKLNRPKGVRSLSIQNNSTKVSSLSDNHSDNSAGKGGNASAKRNQS